MTARTKRAAKQQPSRLKVVSTESLPEELELLLARFRLLASLRLRWLEKLWAEESAPSAKEIISRSEIETILADRDAPAREFEWLEQDETARRDRKVLKKIESSIAAGNSRLAAIENIFSLSPEDSDLLQACIAVAFDPSLARVCAYLQDHTGRTYLTEALAARLFHYSRGSIWSPDSPLFRWELVTAKDVGPGEPRALACDPYIREWLSGKATMDEYLVDVAQPCEPRVPIRPGLIHETVDFINRSLQDASSNRLRITIAGARGSGRRTLAANISATVGLPLLLIDADLIDEQKWPRVFMRAQRQAYLERRAIAWIGENLVKRTWPALSSFPLQFALCEAGQELPKVSGLIERTVRIPPLGIDERLQLWQEYLPDSKKWPKGNLDSLAQSFRVHVGDIADVARTRVSNSEEVIEQVRQAARARLGNLAQILECPFGWDDLVVSPASQETLKDIVFEASKRGAFWEQENARRLFPQGRGLMALFSGPPGTGKTMAAQVIAAELNHDLFRIDLSTVVSKYVGETSQNLEKVLSRATDMDAVLLFDEADALFSKRVTEVRDAQDKFANTDAAYLLQAIESFPGIAILATNQKHNIDSAFIRRLRFVLTFEPPDAAQRLAIWTRVIAALEGAERVETLRAELESLAGSLDVTGAQIKFAVLGATFIARRAHEELAMGHILRGLERELAKEGRSLGARERRRMADHGA